MPKNPAAVLTPHFAGVAVPVPAQYVCRKTYRLSLRHAVDADRIAAIDNCHALKTKGDL